jgi:hypothetical protein
MCIDNPTRFIVDTARVRVVKQCNRETPLTLHHLLRAFTYAIALLITRRRRRRTVTHVLATFRLDRFEFRELVRREHAAQCLYQFLLMLLHRRRHFRPGGTLPGGFELLSFCFMFCTLLLEDALHFRLLRIIEA